MLIYINFSFDFLGLDNVDFENYLNMAIRIQACHPGVSPLSFTIHFISTYS